MLELHSEGWQRELYGAPVSLRPVVDRHAATGETHASLPGYTAPRSLPLTYVVAKRAFDCVAATLLLVALAPVFLVIALAIKSSSRGPILFRQSRLGRNGKRFECLKFRTMVENAEEMLRRDPDLQAQYEAAGFKLKVDSRITPLGAWLRRTSLDELPQLFNVLAGDMSLIGPRPIVPKEIERYGVYGDKLLSVLPGLGGLWQASGRSDLSYAERVCLDMDYVDNCSFFYDIKVLLDTAYSVAASRGAY
ncbi:MAG: sugar transferase [Capsulimonadaceae bacterium]